MIKINHKKKMFLLDNIKMITKKKKYKIKSKMKKIKIIHF